MPQRPPCSTLKAEGPRLNFVQGLSPELLGGASAALLAMLVMLLVAAGGSSAPAGGATHNAHLSPRSGGIAESLLYLQIKHEIHSIQPNFGPIGTMYSPLIKIKGLRKESSKKNYLY